MKKKKQLKQESARQKILGLLKCAFGKCSEAIITGYKAMVHSSVEYACPVWNPHQQYVSEKKKLGKIQRKKMLTSSLPNVCLSISSGFKTCSIYM